MRPLRSARERRLRVVLALLSLAAGLMACGGGDHGYVVAAGAVEEEAPGSPDPWLLPGDPVPTSTTTPATTSTTTVPPAAEVPGPMSTSTSATATDRTLWRSGSETVRISFHDATTPGEGCTAPSG